MKTLPKTILILVIAVVGCSHDESTSPEISDVGKTVTMDPNNILFTTPTLNDAIPATQQGSNVPADCIQLHEDDWRQFEFVPDNLKPEVDAELADINKIWNDHSVPLGDSGTAFNQIHVRKRIPKALAISMSLEEFKILTGKEPKTMTFFDYGEVLRNVHAVTIDNLIVYAHIQNDTVIALGFNVKERFTLPPEFAKRLSEFVRTHNLMLIHWRSRTLLESHDDVMGYFGTAG